MKATEKIANKLKLLREINNYTQEYVANVLDISPNTYSLLEKGQAQYTIERMEKIATLYKMDLSDFLKLNDQTIIHQITHSNGICSDNVNIHQGMPDEERKQFNETINRLVEQNNKLMTLIERLSDKLHIEK